MLQTTKNEITRSIPVRRRSIAPLCMALFTAVFVFGPGPTAQAALVSRNIGVTLNASNLDDYNLDVDQNGTTDFTFQTAYVPDPVLTVGFDQIKFLFGSNNAAVIDKQTGDGFPPTSLLAPGDVVSSASLFSGPNDTADLYYDDTIDPITGNFGGNSGFVGFRFDGAGGIHYGYAQVSVSSLTDPNNPFNLTIGTVVYDDVAGASVQISAVPEPTALAALAPVALGLSIFSRKRKCSGAN